MVLSHFIFWCPHCSPSCISRILPYLVPGLLHFLLSLSPLPRVLKHFWTTCGIQYMPLDIKALEFFLCPSGCGSQPKGWVWLVSGCHLLYLDPAFQIVEVGGTSSKVGKEKCLVASLGTVRRGLLPSIASAEGLAGSSQLESPPGSSLCPSLDANPAARGQADI